MLKSVRYRNDAKIIFGVGLVLCALACVVYGVLMLPAVKGVEFQWEYLAIIGGTAVAFALASLLFCCIGAAYASREKREEEAQEQNLALAVEPLEVVPTPCEKIAETEAPASVDCTENDPLAKNPLLSLDVKKAAKIAVPAVAACVLISACSKNAKYAKQAKKRKDLYRWLG